MTDRRFATNADALASAQRLIAKHHKALERLAAYDNQPTQHPSQLRVQRATTEPKP